MFSASLCIQFPDLHSDKEALVSAAHCLFALPVVGRPTTKKSNNPANLLWMWYSRQRMFIPHEHEQICVNFSHGGPFCTLMD